MLVGGDKDFDRIRVPSESMLPTYEVDEILLLDKSAYESNEPRRHDVVVFRPPRSVTAGVPCAVRRAPNQPCPAPGKRPAPVRFLQRIIALPGERVSVRDGATYVDGELDERFARLDPSCHNCDRERPITVPADHYFVVGDNRGASLDSRDFGPVPRGWIIGRIVGTD